MGEQGGGGGDFAGGGDFGGGDFCGGGDMGGGELGGGDCVEETIIPAATAELICPTTVTIIRSSTMQQAS